MAEHRQFIRQEPADAEEYIGLEGELVIELGTFLIRVHDGITPGGYATLTLASALAQFVTLTDFNAAVAQIISDVTVINDDAIEEIFGAILIQKGPVLDILTGPPGSPAAGDRYLIAAGGTSGIFIGKENQVVEYLDSTTPLFSGTPLEGHFVYVADVDTVYYYTTSWGTVNPDATYVAQLASTAAAIALKANIASPTFTGVPAGPTAAFDTNTTQLATTAFVLAQISGGVEGGDFDNDLVTNGFQKFPGGLIVQWGQGADDAADDSQLTQTINFGMAFPTACLVCLVSKRINSASASSDNWYEVVGAPTTTQVVIERQHGEGGLYTGSTTRPIILAIGY